MPTTTEQVTTRPFHKTIIEAIERCSNPTRSSEEAFNLFQLIKDTKISEGHDEIIAAIDKLFDFPGGEHWARELSEVKESILSQKQVNESEKETLTPDELRAEMEWILELLDEHQDWPGFMNKDLRGSLRQLHERLSKHFGP